MKSIWCFKIFLSIFNNHTWKKRLFFIKFFSFLLHDIVNLIIQSITGIFSLQLILF